MSHPGAGVDRERLPDGPSRGPRPRIAELLWLHRKAGGTSLVFAAGVALPRAAGFLTVPVYARILGPSDFGAYEILVAVVALLYALTSLGLDFAIAVRHFGQPDEGRRSDASSAVWIGAAVSSATALALMLVSLVVGPVTGLADDRIVVVITLAAVPFNVVGGILSMILRLRFAASAFLMALLVGTMLGVVVGVVAVALAGLGLVGAMLGILVTYVATFGLLLVGARSGLTRSSVSRSRIRDLVRVGAPLVPAAASTWVFAVADRFFIGALFGLYEVGLYAAAARLATALALVQYGFHAAWGPIALRWSTQPDADARFAASLRLVVITGGALAAIVSWLAGPLIWLLAGPAFIAGQDVVWLLATSVLFSAMFNTVQIGASVAKRGDRIALATILAAVVNTVANVILIPRLGYLGAGVATLTAFVVAFVIMTVLSQGVRPYRLEVRGSVAWAVAWTTVAGLSRVVPDDWQAFGAATVIAAGALSSVRAMTRFLEQLPAPDAGQAIGESE